MRSVIAPYCKYEKYKYTEWKRTLYRTLERMHCISPIWCVCETRSCWNRNVRASHQMSDIWIVIVLVTDILGNWWCFIFTTQATEWKRTLYRTLERMHCISPIWCVCETRSCWNRNVRASHQMSDIWIVIVLVTDLRAVIQLGERWHRTKYAHALSMLCNDFHQQIWLFFSSLLLSFTLILYVVHA